jgi:hypothetical protein
MGSLEKGRKLEIGRAARRQAEQHQQFLNGQTLSLQNRLARTGLDEAVSVQSRTRIEDAACFDEQRTYGYALDHAQYTRLTAFASSGTDLPVTTVYIAPTEHTSGLLKDTEGKLYTDSFYVTRKDEDGKPMIEHIKPSRPIPLDSIFVDPEDPILGKYLPERSRRVIEFTNDKHETKQVLAAAGINVPRDVLLTPDMSNAQIQQKYHQLATSLQPGSEVVFKPNTDYCCGEFVTMGNESSQQFCVTVMNNASQLREEGTTALFEERIVPPSSPKLAQRINDYMDQVDPDGTHYTRLQPTDVDYNFRVITTLERNPEVIDAEIRYQQKSNQPVNRATGAGAVRTDFIQDPELVENVYDTAKQAVALIYQHVHKPDEPDFLPDFIGIDLIPNQERTIYVFEIQAGPQGFGTLATIDRQLNQGISNVLIPAQMQALQEPFANRQPVAPESLTRIPDNQDTVLIRYRSYVRGGDYQNAQKLVYTLVTEYNYWSPEEALQGFDELVAASNDNTIALQYVNKLLTEDPNNPTYQQYKTKFKKHNQ